MGISPISISATINRLIGSVRAGHFRPAHMVPTNREKEHDS